jgi:hypothetical protein
MLVLRGPGPVDECPPASWCSIYLTQPAILARVPGRNNEQAPQQAPQEAAGSADLSRSPRRSTLCMYVQRMLRMLDSAVLAVWYRISSTVHPAMATDPAPRGGPLQAISSAARLRPGACFSWGSICCSWMGDAHLPPCIPEHWPVRRWTSAPTNKALLCRCAIYPRGPMTNTQGFQIPSRLA